MATATRTPATGSGVVFYRLSVRQFEKMIDAGVFPDGARVELLGGMLVDQMTKNDHHNFTVGRLGKILGRLLPSDWFAREEKSVRLGLLWRPEPDVAVVRGPDDLYRDRTPQAKDIGLVIEVVDTTYAKDRGEKWRGYAAARVRTYWIVNLPARRVEVYTDPTARGLAAKYRACVTYSPGDEVPVMIEDREVGRVAVRDILP
jgi:Uma2 family endonuclease